MGVSTTNDNPFKLPNTFPFSFSYNKEIGLIFQESTPELCGILEKAYRCGQLIGTPLDDSASGKPYSEDFLSFIQKLNLPIDSKVLEIGAGVGYLTGRLRSFGMRTTAIEPGSGYESHLIRNGIKVIKDFFPTIKVIKMLMKKYTWVTS